MTQSQQGQGPKGTIAARFAEFVSAFTWRRPLLAILIAVLLSVVWVPYASNLAPQSDWRMWFDPADPLYQTYDQVEKVFDRTDTVSFTFHVEEGDQFTRARLSAIHQLTEELWQLPYATRVDSLTNFQYSYASGDDIFVEDLVVDPEGLSEEDLGRIRQRALIEPLLEAQLSKDGKTTAVVVTHTLPMTSATETGEVHQAAQVIHERLVKENPDQRILYTGSIALGAELERINAEDFGFRLPIMFVLISILTAILLRSFWATLAALSVVILTILATMGFGGLAGYGLHTGTTPVPIILLTIGLADAVHIVVTAFSLQSRGWEKEAAIRESVRLNALPIALTSITTAIGFLSLNFSAAPPFAEMGNLTAFGVLFAMVLSFWIIPATLKWIPARTPRKERERTTLIDWIAQFPIRLPHLSLLLSLGVLILVAIQIRSIELNDHFVGYFPESTEIRQHINFTETVLPGSGQILMVIDSKQSGGIADPIYLSYVSQLAEWLRTQPEVTFVNSIDLVFKKQNQNMNGGDPAYYSIPQDQQTASQYLLLYEMSLRQGQDLNNQINVDKSKSLMSINVYERPSAEMKELEARILEWVDQNFPPSIDAVTTGANIMFSHINLSNIRSMLLGSAVAIFLISLITAIAIRNTRLGGLSLVVNITPIIMAFGTWAYLVGEINFAASVVAAVTIGIVVDFTIHFLSKYRLILLEQHLTEKEAVEETFGTVGYALVVLTVVLSVGFFFVGLSDFGISQAIGRLVALAVLFGLFMDFFFMPAALIVFRRFFAVR